MNHDINVKKNVDFRVCRGRRSNTGRYFALGVGHCASQIVGNSVHRGPTDKQAIAVVVSNLLLVQIDSDALGLERIHSTVGCVRVEAERSSRTVTGTQGVPLSHLGVDTLVIVVDYITLLKGAKIGSGLSLDPEKFGLVEVAGDIRNHVGSNHGQVYGQNKRHKAVAYLNAVRSAHFNPSKDAGRLDSTIGQKQHVFDSLVGTGKQIGRWLAFVPHFVALQCTGAHAGNHGSRFACHFKDRILDTTFKDTITLFGFSLGFRYQKRTVFHP